MARVLLVDDDPDQLEIRSLILERFGHRVGSAETPEEALEQCRRAMPDVVVMDLRLPKAEDGLRLIRELRALSASVPILVMSGWPEDLADHPEAEMVNRFLRKPVRSQDLVLFIDGVA